MDGTQVIYLVSPKGKLISKQSQSSLHPPSKLLGPDQGKGKQKLVVKEDDKEYQLHF
jgi:hypothetical protein